MIIGIDAKQYFTGPISTKIILQNVLPLLFELYTEHQWIVFLNSKDKHRGSPFKQINVRIEYVYTPTNMLSNLFLLSRHIRKNKIDVSLFMMFPALFNKTRSVVFIHDVLFRQFPQYFTWKEKLYFKPIAWLLPKADRIICTTEFVSKKLIEYGYVTSNEKIDIAPLGIAGNFKPLNQHDEISVKAVKKKFNLPDKYILFVGRLNTRKNIEGLLKALTILPDKEIPLVIVGEKDWKAPDLQQHLSNVALKTRIQFTGGVTDSELVVIYALSTIFCFPSFAEGFGLPPLEAMASGVPVIVSKNTALAEVCGDAALYINPHKPEDITSAITTLLDDQFLYNEKRILGFERAKEFTWSGCAHRIMKSIQAAQASS